MLTLNHIVKQGYITVGFNIVNIMWLLGEPENYVWPLKCRFINNDHICAFFYFSVIGKKVSIGNILVSCFTQRRKQETLWQSEREANHSLGPLHPLNRICCALANRVWAHTAFPCTALLTIKESCLLHFKLTYLFEG